MSISAELENYLLENEHLSTITLRTYKLNYEKLTDLLNSDTINDVPQTEIIKVVEAQIPNPNSKIMLINVAMNIKKHLKNRVELFRVTSGPRKTENALKLLHKALYNIKNKRYIKNRLSCERCTFRHTNECP